MPLNIFEAIKLHIHNQSRQKFTFVFFLDENYRRNSILYKLFIYIFDYLLIKLFYKCTIRVYICIFIVIRYFD